MRKRLYMAAFLLVPLLLGAGVLLEHSHVTMGKQVAFTGLDLKNAPTALPGAGATKCVNYVFDKNASLHVRKGLDQWNATTYPNSVRYLYSFVSETGFGYYVVQTEDSAWVVQDYETDFSDQTITMPKISNGTVDCYASSPFLHVGDTDSNYYWKAILGGGSDNMVKIGNRDSEYRILAVYEDTLIKLDSNLFDGDDSTYYIEIADFDINQVTDCNRIPYLATTVGLLWCDGDNVDFGDTVSYVSDTSQTGKPQYSGSKDYFPFGRLQWGSNITANENEVVAIGMAPYLSDTTKQEAQSRGKYFTMQYPLAPWPNQVFTWGAAMLPEDDSVTQITVYPVEVDSSTRITFLCDSVEVSYVEIEGGSLVYLNRFYPADSMAAWDSTRFETGDWIVTSADATVPANRCTIPGLIIYVNSDDTAFYACEGPYRTTHADTVTLQAMRRRKQTETEANYICLAAYKDRLFTVRSDAPDFLRYSPAFYPDSVDAYQVIGLDITNGDRIERMAVLYDNLYIFTRNTIHQLSGDPSSPSATLGRLFDGVGISAPKTFVVFEGRMLLCHQTGFYLFDGSRPQLISAAILPIIADSINWTAAGDVMCAGYYDRHLWVSYPSGASSSNNRTLVYNVDDGRWGNVSFVAGAYHKITNPSDTNKFLVGDADTGAVYVYKGHDDDGTAIQATYETGWSDFGSEVEKQIQGFHVVFDKSAACSLSINLYRNDTIVATTIIDTLTYSQSFLDKHKNVYDLDAIGRLFKVGIDMNSSAGEGWVSELTLEVVEAGEKRYDR